MKKALLFFLTSAIVLTASAVTLKKADKVWHISNDHYEGNLDSGKACRLNLTKLNGKAIKASFTPHTYLNREREKWNGTFSTDSSLVVSRGKAKHNVKVLTETKDKVVLEITYDYPQGKCKEVISFDNTPLIRYDVTVDFTSRLGQHRFAAQIFWNNSDDVLYYPDRKMVRGLWGAQGKLDTDPTWRFIWYGKDKVGLGLVAPQGKNYSGLQYSHMRKQDNWKADQANLAITNSPLGQYGHKGSVNFTYYAIAGGTPELAQSLAEKILGKKSCVKFFSYETEKLVIRPGDKNKIFAEVLNTTGAKQELTMKTVINYGLDTEKEVNTQKVTVADGEYKKVEIPLTFPKEALRGVAIRTDLIDAKGKVVDSKLDFCSITNYAPRDAGFGIINSKQAHQHGSQDAWNQVFKQNYVGAYEYYCWAPSVIFGLAPEEEAWKPETEHNYREIITRTFIKELVDNAHSKGVGVYAWISGLWNYKMAMKRPEWIQYTVDGYPNLYSGMVYGNDDRRAVVKPNMFYPERARIWAEEMAKSIDMFGWDGSRWDWGFVPSSKCDPLYHGDKVDNWYDQSGKSMAELFPDPDQTGVDCLKAWREVLEKRHPNFIHGTNYSSREEGWQQSPKYHKENARDALVLFEDMLGFQREPWKSFDRWGKELAIRCDRVRPYNAAPVVGAMRGLPAYSVSYQLANYTCASAGVKWWAYCSIAPMMRDHIRNRYLMRFAEWYFETSFLRPEKCPVETKEKNVLFEPFTRERKTADGREVVVPLVNMPEGNWNICEFHLEPEVKAVTLKLALKAGETIKTAWLMTPEKPEKAVKLEVKNGSVTVPELHHAAMVLFQCKGGK